MFMFASTYFAVPRGRGTMGELGVYLMQKPGGCTLHKGERTRPVYDSKIRVFRRLA